METGSNYHGERAAEPGAQTAWGRVYRVCRLWQENYCVCEEGQAVCTEGTSRRGAGSSGQVHRAAWVGLERAHPGDLGRQPGTDKGRGARHGTPVGGGAEVGRAQGTVGTLADKAQHAGGARAEQIRGDFSPCPSLCHTGGFGQQPQPLGRPLVGNPDLLNVTPLT